MKPFPDISPVTFPVSRFTFSLKPLHSWIFLSLCLALLFGALTAIPLAAASPTSPQAPTVVTPTLLYVNIAVTGTTHDGLSWTTAFTTVQNALDWTNSHYTQTFEVWVAKGVYYPDEAAGHAPGQEGESFRINRNNVQLYGGFVGTETLRSRRNWTANRTILSGDIDHNDLNTDGNFTAENWNAITGTNAYHVLYLDGSAYQALTETTAVDGFIITGGSATASSPNDSGGGIYSSGNRGCSARLSNLLISGNQARAYGGGLYNTSSNGNIASPILIAVTFSGNWANDGGAGLANYTAGGIASPQLTAVIFQGNQAEKFGAGMLNRAYGGTASPTFINVLFSGNRVNATSGYGGGLYNLSQLSGTINTTLINVTFAGNNGGGYGGALASDEISGTIVNTLNNNILWNNDARNNPAIYNNGSTTSADYSDIQGGISGPGNLNTDPYFVLPIAPASAPTTTGNYRLQPYSPAIDAGNTAAITIGADLEGRPRLVGAAVDMGAYESSNYQLRVKKAGSGNVTLSTIPAGINCGITCSYAYTPNTLIQLSALPAINTNFNGWSGAVVGTATPITLNMDAAKTVTALFTIKTFQITPTAGAHGTITPTTVQTVNYGSSKSFVITPDLGYVVQNLAVDGVAVTPTTRYTFTNITASHTLSVAFGVKNFLITSTLVGSGTVAPGLLQTVPAGTNQIMTITPASGWRLVDVVVDGLAIGPVTNYTFTAVSADHTITAFFSEGLPPLYVDKDAVGANDGTSWANAYTKLQSALDWLNAGNSGREIWVAEGVYYPDEGGSHVDNSQSEYFTINRSYIQLYGGFAATETLRAQRNWNLHRTILSGDIDKNDSNGDGNYIAENWNALVGSNSYHVIKLNGSATITDNVVIDGFTLTAGSARDASAQETSGGGIDCWAGEPGQACSPTLSNLTLSGNLAIGSGGGVALAVMNSGTAVSPKLTNVIFSGNKTIYNNGGGLDIINNSGGISRPQLVNVIFRGNQCYNGGGGMHTYTSNASSVAVLINVLFSGNASTESPIQKGGGFYNQGRASISMINVTFSGNRATADSPDSYGGAIYNESGTIGLTNCILWNDYARNGPEIYNDPYVGGSTQVNNSNIQNGNLNLDPQFVNPAAYSSAPTTAGDYRLNLSSPMIEAGNAAGITVLTDLDGNPRIYGPNIDLGAYESPYLLFKVNRVGPGGRITSSPAGVDCGAACTTGFRPGTPVTLTAAPYISATFAGWTGDLTSTANLITLTVDTIKTLTATFDTRTFIITPTAGANGTLNPATAQVVTYGSSPLFSITPDTGYHVADVRVDGISVGAVTQYTFNNVTAGHTLTAAFAVNTYQIVPTAGANGTITPGTPLTFTHGSTQSYTITPAIGYKVQDVKVDGASVGAVSRYTFTNIIANHTLVASFLLSTFTITPTAGANGIISPSTAQTATYLMTRTFTIRPAGGYHIADVRVDGASVGPVTRYTFTNVTANHTLTAAFAEGPQVIYVDKDATGANNGSSWANAYTQLQSALDEANASDIIGYEIRVAEGVYYPDEGGGHIDNAVTETFSINRREIQLYGGFAGTETLRTQRNWTAHPTILSGDIDKNDVNTDGNFIAETWNHLAGANAAYVVWLEGSNSLTESTVLDGFFITAGKTTDGGAGLYCNGNSSDKVRLCSPTLANLTFSGNSAGGNGGGLYINVDNNGTGSPLLTNVIFSGNQSDFTGGGLAIYGSGLSRPRLTNVVFRGNQATINGGGMAVTAYYGNAYPVLTNVLFSGNYVSNYIGKGGGYYNLTTSSSSYPTLINVTFSGNRAGTSLGAGGAMANLNSTPVMTNCLFWNNYASASPEIYSNGTPVNIAYSDIRGGFAGAGNLNLDPQFIAPITYTAAPTTTGNYRLQAGSPLLDAGYSAAVTTATDLDGNPRLVGAAVEMGAYESSYLKLTLNRAGTGGGTVTSTVGGINCDATCAYGYLPGTVVTLTAAPLVSSTFVGWSGGAVGSTTPVTVLINNAKTVTAAFNLRTLLITPTAGSNGAIAPTGAQSVTYGTNQTFTITPNTGYHILDVRADGASVGAVSRYTFTNVTANHTLTAAFAVNSYPITPTAGSGGAIAPATVQNVIHGAGQSFTITPNANYHVLDVRADGISVGAVTRYTFTNVTAAHIITAAFTLNTYLITPTAGSGGSISPAGVQTIPYDSSRTFYIVPNPGYDIIDVGVDGMALGPLGSFTFTHIDANHTITALFALSNYTLTLTTVGNGSATVTPTQAVYHYGDIVTLTAIPDAGWYFGQWSGNANSTLTQTQILMNGRKTVTATFLELPPTTYTLTVIQVGNGTLTPTAGAHSYLSGTVVELAAAPDPGWTFTDWSGAANGNTVPVTVTMDGAQTVTATFTANEYPLTITAAGQGQVTVEPDQPTYHYGDIVTFTAVPTPGWSFAGWSGRADGAANPLTLTVEGAAALTATFTQDEYTLNAAAVGNGNLTVEPNQPTYRYGDAVTLTAAADPGWSFAGWSGDLSGSANPTTITLTGNAAVTATFTEDEYTLSTAVDGSGLITVEPDQPTYRHGDTVALTAAADPGWSFAGWSGALSGTANPASLILTANAAVTAAFTEDEYTLDLTITGEGTVQVEPAQENYHYGDVVTLTAVPTVGWSFAGWNGVKTAVQNPLTLTVTGNTAVMAMFTPNEYPLGITTEGQGAVAVTPQQLAYRYGTVVTLTAAPDPGWTFAGWSGDLSGSTTPITFTVTTTATVTATFTQDEYTLNVAAAGQGTVSVEPDQPTYRYGDIVTLLAAPETGWSFAGWSGAASGNENVKILTLTGNTVVTAAFTEDEYPLNATVVGQGRILQEPAQATYHYGAVVTLTAVPTAGWTFAGWSGAVESSETGITLTLTAPAAVTATFTQNDYTIDVSAVGQGTVALTPDQPTYHYGDVLTFTAVPTPGWSFAGWSGDLTGTANPAFLVIQGNATVTAAFTEDAYLLNPTVEGQGAVTVEPAQPTYRYGDIVTLTAVPTAGWAFVGWSNAFTGTTNPATLTVYRSLTVTAGFYDLSSIYYTLTVGIVGHGTVSPSLGTHSYPSGTVVTLSAAPAAGWDFDNWSGDWIGFSNPAPITMDGSKAVTATFYSGCQAVASPEFTFTPSQPQIGETVTFTGNVAAGTEPLNYSWDWGDGTLTDAGSVITHTFPLTAAVKSYTVTLSVGNECSSPEISTRSITVMPKMLFLPIVMRKA